MGHRVAARTWLWWCPVPADRSPDPTPDPDPTGAELGAVSPARRAQGAAARYALLEGLGRLGLIPDGPDRAARTGLTGPGAVRRVTWDGRPVGAGVQFSLAHTARWALAAVRQADGAPTGFGVDAEDDWDGAARNLHRFATPAELDVLAAALPERPEPAGPVPVHLWCAKEALSKATGRGFVVAPRRYRLQPGTDPAHPLLLAVDAPRQAEAPRCVQVRAGTRRVLPPTAWAVAEYPLRSTEHEGNEASQP